MKSKLSLVFFGSGPVAASSLKLLNLDFEIEAVITKPTTKNEMEMVANGAPVFCVSNKKELSELFVTHKFNSKVGVLIDFGIIVNQDVIDYFELGIVNSHFSILPELRGADPISFALLEGREKTGVSLMLLVQAMDEGPLLGTQEMVITDTDTSVELSTKLVQLSHAVLVEIMPKYLNGEVKPYPQDTNTVAPSYTRKLTKADGIIDWEKPALILEREIKAYIEWPKSKTKLGSVDVVITKAYSAPSNSPDLMPGDIKIVPEINLLSIETKSGCLYVERLKPIGKNEMDTKAFLAGYKDRVFSK
jgi:methionyl-tRNA formyltransferase